MMSERSERRRAVALRYEPSEDVAPVVLARGEGRLAELIIGVAEESGVPVEENPVLALALQGVEVGRPIPPELYEAAAVVFARLMALDAEAVG